MSRTFFAEKMDKGFVCDKFDDIIIVLNNVNISDEENKKIFQQIIKSKHEMIAELKRLKLIGW